MRLYNLIPLHYNPPLEVREHAHFIGFLILHEVRDVSFCTGSLVLILRVEQDSREVWSR